MTNLFIGLILLNAVALLIYGYTSRYKHYKDKYQDKIYLITRIK
jgi:hypothetical protein